ncbi:RNA recognition motif aka RRM, RBD, or RNP domain-containing protein isoform 5 [Cladophialophora immunda]|nr:RNA recognition motif aka RRM, RBD, or RNP domain-containing protein isoform 5 [Cladophialophora immunda]
MSSAVAELDSILQSMLNLKPPGVSGSKITAITSLCTANIQSESVLIQKIYTHFKKTPGTHKLGVLYVIDSVTRQWVDQARKSGQQLGSGAPDGTFAAGVTRVTELLPVLMNDIIATAPEDQKVKIRKLLEIWERSNTFPAPLLASLKEKLDAPKVSTTPEGSPAPGFVPLGHSATTDSMAAKPPPQQDTSAILEALKNMAKQNTAAQPAIPAPAQTSLNNLLGAQNGIPLTNSTVNPGLASAAANGPAVNQLGALFAGLSNGAQSQSPANVPANPLAAFLPQQAPAPAVPQNPAPLSQDAQAQAQVQLQLLQLLASQGVPPDQWATALQLLNMQAAGGAAAGSGGGGGGASASGLPFPPPVPASNWAGQVQAPGPSRDAQTRSPPGQYRRRSRSPGYDRRRDLSPRRRRDSPGADGYRNDRDGRRGDYRQRSPMGRRRRSTTPPSDYKLPPPGPKNVQWDPTLPKGHIKVYSRTLFVGGVTSSEAHLRGLFSKFGVVQTCIVNIDKRHAFIKMINRQDAESAREGMEEYKVGDMQLRTKWGVGFGPRDCSDYQTGISVIPIERLTDADRKWLLTAEYGGTGGAPIQEGMVVEEPDIEIGAGVSSKAMSRRIATDQGGRRGPQSSRQHPGGREDNRYRDNDRRMDRDDRQGSGNPNNIGVMPSMPFPMNFGNMPNGMPGFPPGFQMPAFQPQGKQD